MSELVRIFNKGGEWDAFWDLLQQSFPNRERDESLLIDTEYYALKEEGKIVGTVIVDLESHEHVSLYNVSVDPIQRQRGYGREMLAQLADTLKDRFNYMCLYCEPKNLDFYRALDFELGMLQPAVIHHMYKKLG